MTKSTTLAEKMAEEYAEWNASQRGYPKPLKEAFLAGYAAAENQWIPVSERLPEYGEKVLVMGEQRGMNPQMGGAYQFITSRKDLKGTSVERDRFRLLDENEFAAQYVTHWMPLPTPPKQSK